MQQPQQEETAAIAARMAQIKHKIIVLSGKGGVGKSTVAVNLARALHQAGNTVGLLDADIHGPSVPKMLGMERDQVMPTELGILPVSRGPGFNVMSIGFLLPDSDNAVIWRGPLKNRMIQQFLKDGQWGALDYLVIDLPPGTGDEPLTVAQSIPNADGAIVVTTPQQVAIADVRKCISFCRQLKLPVLGVLENMSGFVCPHCSEHVDIFASGGGETMAKDMAVPFLGSIPIDPAIGVAADSGIAFMDAQPDSPAAQAFSAAVKTLSKRCRPCCAAVAAD
ncbi:MAG: Mrp/NBP35 family ATP-binding protein [Lentisphaerae bacterium]|jgi:ATP-binding protein involved in chromosome partitioning|nr:Mrp/NBP35 family ATP-binding protein [Lentisphaerota bacterium]MBT4823543.1 Mrp/NBP35 family ATP-binding protein [Lentisphaerota bacterium]MBT5612703.1 Mrp/NBP35 family ATP-binding protein [Lentisphaerota bacterium]MBT7060336.1 Mrp/NBP35 family ATP-binding protein [Lentisphaerota bacterium]MBT7845602.1 Mrp/NBP35 family ATP-binding protein [Lentisphaerota bacterium]